MEESTRPDPSCQPETPEVQPMAEDAAPPVEEPIVFKPACDPAEFVLAVFALRQMAEQIMQTMEELEGDFHRQMQLRVYARIDAGEASEEVNRKIPVDRWGQEWEAAGVAVEKLGQSLLQFDNFAPGDVVSAALRKRLGW